MRALRQLVQVLDPRLGAAAARAQQVPAHDHDAQALRGEEQLDSVLRAILSAFGVKILDVSKREDVQLWKKVSGARYH